MNVNSNIFTMYLNTLVHRIYFICKSFIFYAMIKKNIKNCVYNLLVVNIYNIFIENN